MSAAKILIIDDEKIIRERLKSLLELDNYIVFCAEDGPRGLEIFEKEKPEIVIVDIKMPGMDGIEVLHSVKEKSKETEIIIITGHGELDTAIQAIKKGAFDYNKKPVNYDELEISIRRALEKQEMQRRLDEFVIELKNHRDHLQYLVEERTAELLKARDLAETANRAKSDFLANMSHELKTPLNSLLGFTKLMKSGYEEESYQNNLDSMLSSGEYLLGLINGIFDIIKIETGDVKFNMKPIFINAILEASLSEVRHIAEKKNVNIEYLPNTDNARINGDAKWLQKIFINLLGNAVKFSKESGSVALKTSKDNAVFRADIIDSGVGIKKEDQERIFQIFNQVKDNLLIRGNEGAGLGLALTKHLVQVHKGSITVTSNKDKGSIFTVKFPCVN